MKIKHKPLNKSNNEFGRPGNENGLWKKKKMQIWKSIYVCAEAWNHFIGGTEMFPAGVMVWKYSPDLFLIPLISKRPTYVEGGMNSRGEWILIYGIQRVLNYSP